MKITFIKVSELPNYKPKQKRKEYKKRIKQDLFDLPIRFLFMKELSS